ncbi:MAG: hypothetical protein QM608_04460 [Caulobacter sp.]
MAQDRNGRIAILAARIQRKRRLPAITASWKALDVAISPLSDELHEDLLARLAAVPPSHAWQEEADLAGRLAAFVAEYDTIVVLPWSSGHPSFLVPAHALPRVGLQIRDIHRDGFFAVTPNRSRALLIDFDDHEALPSVEQLELRG